MDQAVEKFIDWLQQEEDNVMKNTQQDAREKYRRHLLYGKNFLGENTQNVKQSIYLNISKDILDKYRQNGIMKKLCKIDYLITILKDKNQQLNSENVLFTEFAMLSELLSESDLNAKEKVNVVLFFLEQNMRNFAEDAFIVAYEDIKDLKMPSMTEMEFKEFVQGESFAAFFEKDFDELSEEEKIFDIQLRNRIEEKKLSNAIIIALKSIQRHYFNKLENWNETDIRITAKSMEILGVTPEIYLAFQKMFEKKLMKVKKERQNLLTPASDKKSNYDFKALEKEASEAIDLKNMKPKRYLTLEEKIYYLSILTRMNVSKEEKSLFLRNCEIFSKKVTPLQEYLENFNRLQYYEESVGLQKENTFMEECFKEMMLCNHEDYCFWKQNLEETLKQVEHWIPKNYEYEEKEASRLLNK